jgi:Ca-activated chloride channel family protein
LRHAFSKVISPWLVVLLICLPAVAQEPGQDDVIRVQTDLVSVPVVVFDSHGTRVFGLKAEDFVVCDDGRVAKLQHFSTGTNHVALAFLLDASGSAQEYVARQRETALALFGRFGPDSEVAVLRFTEKLDVRVPFTTNVGRANAGFSFESGTNHHTAIFDSAATLVQLISQRRTDPTERRIIILTSDGLDTASTKHATEVINQARVGAISFYVIHFPLFTPSDGRLVPRSPAKGFRDLAEKTGGRYFMVGDAKSALDPNARYDLTSVFKAIEEDLASQYVLGFYAGDAGHDGRVHRVDVQLARNNRRLRVKTLRDEYTLKQ